MANFNASPLIAQFGRREDSRVECAQLHRLPDILGMSVCAVKFGVGKWVEEVDFRPAPSGRGGSENWIWHMGSPSTTFSDGYVGT